MVECLDDYVASHTSNWNGGCTWPELRRVALQEVAREPLLRAWMDAALLNHCDFSDALAHLLAHQLGAPNLGVSALLALIHEIYAMDPTLPACALQDLNAVMERDPATQSPLQPLLYFRGYRALQAYRIAHHLWCCERQTLALWVQSRMVDCYSIDIHPAAKIGCRVMLDHGTGIVIGETAVVEDDVSILHGVTLGGNGKNTQDRHPKIRHGVMIGAGATIIGNVEVGAGAQVAAGSVVLKPVRPHATVGGIPAQEIGASAQRPVKDAGLALAAEC